MAGQYRFVHLVSEIRPARFPLTGEAQDLAVKRARALALLGKRWVLDPSHAPMRLEAVGAPLVGALMRGGPRHDQP